MLDFSRYILKVKTYKDCFQYSYSPLNYNSKFFKKRDKRFKSSSDEVLRCSLSRSINTIKDLVLSNNFDYFFTITLKTNKRYDILYSSKVILQRFKSLSQTLTNFKYIFVFEKTKKGGLHAHGFVSGLDRIYINNNGYLSCKYFDILGFNSIEPIDKVNPFYIIKYVTKEPVKELKHRYFRSNNLNKPTVEYFHCDTDEFRNFGFNFQNQYCKMITIAK